MLVDLAMHGGALVGSGMGIDVREDKNVEVAEARRVFGRLWIAYNAEVIGVDPTTGVLDPFSTAILAHEFGHHVQAHTFFVGPPGAHNRELAADWFAASVMARMKYTWEETSSAVRHTSIHRTGSHPERALRMDYMAVSWLTTLGLVGVPPEEAVEYAIAVDKNRVRLEEAGTGWRETEPGWGDYWLDEYRWIDTPYGPQFYARIRCFPSAKNRGLEFELYCESPTGRCNVSPRELDSGLSQWAVRQHCEADVGR
ncbi:MAG: hypothetical protein VX899_25260 [Myxococcota bacterium]|nr:hypothetical protein [Myxococcota bacterium]